MSPSVLAAVGLVALAAMHSFLGERRILVPLLAQTWTVAVPRPAADRILRFAWHITSIAWLGLAAAVVGLSPGLVVGLVCLPTAAIVFGSLRTHPAWPIFLLAGLAGLETGDVLPPEVRTLGGVVATAGLAGAAALHWYWVAGGRWLADRVIPTAAPSAADHSPSLPAAWLTALVAIALMIMTLIVGAATAGMDLGPARVIGWVGVALMAARVVGDGRFVGFTKSVRVTAFSRADDLVFTPLLVALVVGATGGLL